MMNHHEPQDDTPMSAAPPAHLALSHLCTQAKQTGANPALVGAARVLAALRPAVVRSGGEHVEH